MLRGSATDQTKQLRDYLVRMTQDIQAASSPETIQQIVKTAAASTDKQKSDTAIADARKRAQALKSLIIKTADEVYSYVDRIVTEMQSIYIAKSDFGEYTETIRRISEETAKETIDSYEYTSMIEALSSSVDDLDTYVTMINGQIRRGIVTDPETGDEVLGITISEDLQFTGQTHDEGGLTYYYLAPGQTLGMYTSTGWQFWINGVKAGWFDSRDGKLHVANIIVENTLQIGDGWLITTDGGFGIRYIGGTT